MLYTFLCHELIILMIPLMTTQVGWILSSKNSGSNDHLVRIIDHRTVAMSHNVMKEAEAVTPIGF